MARLHRQTGKETIQSPCVERKTKLVVLLLWLLAIGPVPVLAQSVDKIDWNKARQLYQKEKKGLTLSKKDQAYLDRAKALRRLKGRQRNSDTTGDNERSRPSVRGTSIPRELCPIEKIEAITEDGKKTRAFYRKPPGDGPFPAMICIHGGVQAASDQTLERLLANNPVYTRMLAAGYVTVAGDFRTYEANPQARGPIWDCLAIVDAVRNLPFVDRKSVVVFGGSGGGSIALELASSTKLAAIVCGEPATLLFCGMLGPGEFDKRFDVLRDPQKHYTDACKTRTRKKLKAIACPVLILHSDQHALKKLNGEVFLPELKAAGVEVEYKAYPGNPHGFYWGAGTNRETVEKFMADTRAFLQPRLKTKATPWKP